MSTPSDPIVTTYTADQIGEILAREAARAAGFSDTDKWHANITIANGPDGMTRATVRVRRLS